MCGVSLHLPTGYIAALGLGVILFSIAATAALHLGTTRNLFDTSEHGVTVSLGAALLRSLEDKDSGNRRADQNMYRAKQRGGNCFEID